MSANQSGQSTECRHDNLNDYRQTTQRQLSRGRLDLSKVDLGKFSFGKVVDGCVQQQ